MSDDTNLPFSPHLVYTLAHFLDRVGDRSVALGAGFTRLIVVGDVEGGEVECVAVLDAVRKVLRDLYKHTVPVLF